MSKRELIDTGSDKRYVRRDKQGAVQGGCRCRPVAVGRQAPQGRTRSEAGRGRQRRPQVQVKIASYNVNGVNGRLDVLLSRMSFAFKN
jgi:hypothetical protein